MTTSSVRGTPVGRGTPVVALRPLGTTELLDSAVRAVWAQRRAVFPIAIPVAVLMTLGAAVLQYATLGDTSAGLLSFASSLLIRVFGGVLLAGLIAPAVSDSMLGEQIGAGTCLRAVGLRAAALVLLAIVLTAGEGVGLVLGLVGGVWLWGVWAAAAPAFTLERLGPFAALRRSSRLVRGEFWHVWGVRALGWLVTTVIGAVAVLPFELIALAVARVSSFGQAGQSIGKPGLFVIITSIGSVLGALVTAPVSAAIDSLIYIDLRMRREGMDIVMTLPPLTTTSAAPSGPAPSGLAPSGPAPSDLAPGTAAPW